MTTKRARDFLDKELFVKRDIVTFRSLSRELGIHVNDAKKELQHYYDALRDTDAPAVPTYLVSGDIPALTIPPYPASQRSESSMDMDLDFDEDGVAGETDVVLQSQVLLVDARVLEDTKAQFTHVHGVHIYSLSPSRFGDAGLVCTPSGKVQRADVEGGPTLFSVVGKITGPHVKLRTDAVTGQCAASSSKTTLDAPPKAPPKLVAPSNAEQRSTKGKAPALDMNKRDSMNSEPKVGPRTSGKLDWSKAKAKERVPTESTREEKKPKREPDPPVTATTSARKKPAREPTKPSIFKTRASDDAEKRGIKRKPVVDDGSESESEPSSVKAKPSRAAGPSVKKEVVYSDDDEDGAVRMPGLRRLRRKSAVTSDSEMSLRAMMDIDDDQVDHVPRAGKALPQREESEESEVEMDVLEKETTAPPVTTEDDESDHLPVVQKKRKPRKVVPVGRNGLKKRRVVKSRTTTDAKGYMQTEDYSSYESVEEDEEEEIKPKGKGKGRETKKVTERVEEVKPKVEKSAGNLKAKSTAKPRGGASKRGGLLNFFGPDKGKK